MPPQWTDASRICCAATIATKPLRTYNKDERDKLSKAWEERLDAF